MNKRDIELLFELGAFRYVPRTWRQFLNKDFANNAEHSFRTAWTAMLIATLEKADIAKTVMMALLHDLGESRAGDANYLSRMYVKRNEELGFTDMIENTTIKKEILPLWKEYQERKSLESKCAKDADSLDVDLEIQEQRARGYDGYSRIWKKHRAVTASKLYTKSAKKIWKALQNADPHAWHTNGRNRYTSGDWKPKKK